MLGKLLRIYISNKQMAITIFSFFKFGIMNTSKKGFKGRSVVFGIWKLQLQINLSYVSNNERYKIFAEA